MAIDTCSRSFATSPMRVLIRASVSALLPTFSPRKIRAFSRFQTYHRPSSLRTPAIARVYGARRECPFSRTQRRRQKYARPEPTENEETQRSLSEQSTRRIGRRVPRPWLRVLLVRFLRIFGIVNTRAVARTLIIGTSQRRSCVRRLECFRQFVLYIYRTHAIWLVGGKHVTCGLGSRGLFANHFCEGTEERVVAQRLHISRREGLEDTR
jgi:hypothetical protein